MEKKELDEKLESKTVVEPSKSEEKGEEATENFKDTTVYEESSQQEKNEVVDEKELIDFGSIFGKRKVTKSSLILSIISGVMFTILGILGLFYKPLVAAFIIGQVFGLILMFMAVSVFILSLTSKKQGVKEWYLFTILGVLSFISGIIFYNSPIIDTYYLVIITAIFFLWHGIIKLFTNREDWPVSLLLIILSILMLVYPAYFLVWGYITLFILFVINGVLTIFHSVKAWPQALKRREMETAETETAETETEETETAETETAETETEEMETAETETAETETAETETEEIETEETEIEETEVEESEKQ